MESIQYQLAHLNDDRGPQFLRIIVCLLVLATASVSLRLLSRRLLHTNCQADDYAIVVGLIFYWGISIAGLIAYRYGFGKHAIAIGYRNVIINVKLIFVFEILCTICIYAVKLSILLFYRRVFPTPRFQRVVNIAMIILTATYLSFLVTFFAQCIPINYLWDRSIKGGRCIHVVLALRVTAIINMLADVIVLLIPMPVVWRLPQISLSQKLGMSGMFCLGGVVCVTGFVRIFVLGQVSEVDPTWSDFNAAAWTYAEACVGIFCACLPMMRPLFTTRLWRRVRSTVNNDGNKRSAGNNGNNAEDPREAWPRRNNSSGSNANTIINSEDSRSSWPKIIVTSPGGGEEKTSELKRWKSTGHGDYPGAPERIHRDLSTRNCRRVQSLLPLSAIHVREMIEGTADWEKGEEEGNNHTTQHFAANKPAESVDDCSRRHRPNRESRGPSWPLPNDVIISDTSGELDEPADNNNNNLKRWKSTPQRHSKTIELAAAAAGPPPPENNTHNKKRWITRVSYDPVQNLLPLSAADVQKMVEWAEKGKRRSRS